MIPKPLILWIMVVCFCPGTAVSGDGEACTSSATELLGERLSSLRMSHPHATCLAVAFAEERSFPFRRQARKLKGRLLRDLESGRFVFDYEAPRRLKLIYENDLVWLVRGSRAPERVPEAADSLSLFAALFKEDIMALSEDWTMSTESRGGDTFFQLIPRSPAAKEAYKRVELLFSADALRQVVVVRENAVEHRYTFDLPEPMDCREFAAIFE